MEPIYRRPQLGEIFCPSRHTLYEENNYLSKVGLIILIRGSPSPDTPRIVAQTLDAVHGGRQSDYVIDEATIAPYLLTDRSTQLRDAVVQRGIYTVSQAHIQFVVHKWRPRFGMGYDPPTHQVWVKIVGLPLQAWTVPEVTAIIQNFGHPLNILPFRRAAGNYKDITALVATNDSNRIPLAYTYREGDYTTQVDIYILNWRLWDKSYFPPPEDFAPRQNSCAHQYHRGDLVNPQRNSPSSSSSNGIPSEPTINLSAWSPRSHQSTVLPELLSPRQTLQVANRKNQGEGTLQLEGRKLAPLPSLDCSLVTAHRRHRTPATENLNPTQESAQISMLLNACLTPALTSNPITINFLYLLRMANCHRVTLRVARKNSTQFFSHTISFVLEKSQDEVQEGAALKNTRCALNLSSMTFYDLLRTGPAEGPLRPKEFDYLNAPPPQTLAQPEEAYNPPLIQTQDRPSPLNEPYNSPQPSEPRQDLFETPKTTQQDARKELDQSIINTQVPATEDPHVLESTLADKRDPQFCPLLSKMAEGARAPTRRSQRLQAKQKKDSTMPRLSAKDTTQSCKIAFVPDYHLAPLDTIKALEILQATGLMVNKQIEDLIDEAVKRDQAIEPPDQPAPQTPLHDHIPPLNVPGTDLLL